MRLGDGVVDVWVVRLTDRTDGQSDVDPGILAPAECERAARLRDGTQRSAYVIAHVALRRVLGASLDVPPGELVFGRDPCPRCGGPDGRPVLVVPAAPLHFSLSRSGGLVLIAVAGAPVGVDVERLPTDRRVADLLSSLHPAEREDVEAAPAGLRRRAFARVWTRKEAYLKGLGTGLGHGLAEQYTGPEGRAPLPAGWSVTDLSTGQDADYAAATAMRGDLLHVRRHPLPPPG